MASRIMHLCVAKLVCETIHFEDQDLFTLGCLAPDLVWYSEGSYDASHFVRTIDHLKGINYQRFLEKYSGDETLSDFKLGYFVHLLTDAIWLNTIQQVYVRTHVEKKAQLYKLGYKDMYKYNPILIKQFSLEKVHVKQVKDLVDEVDVSDFTKMLIDLETDFAVDYIDDAFLVYPYDAVIRFINETAQKSVEFISCIKENGPIEDAINYFVPIGVTGGTTHE